MNVYLLLIYLVQLKTIQSSLHIPIGLLFYGNNQQVYSRINILAREYIFNKLERRFQYNLTEHLDGEDYYYDIDTWSTICDQLSNGIVTIIAHVNSEDLEWLSSFCSAYQIPFVHLNNNNQVSNRYSLSLMPDVLPALLSIIRRYQITQLVYIYDHIDGAQRLKQLMKIQILHLVQNLHIISRYLDNVDDAYDLLQSIEIMTDTQMQILPESHPHPKSPYRYIVLDFYRFDTYRLMMDKIKQRGMTSSRYHYILMTLDAKELDLTYFRYGGVNVTFFSLPSYEDKTINENYVNALRKENAFSVESLLLTDAWELLLRNINRLLSSKDDMRDKTKASRHDMFSNELRKIIDCRHHIIQPWMAGNTYLKSLINTTFQGLSGNIQFSNITGQRKNYKLDVYRVTRNEMPKNIGYFQSPDTLEIADNFSSRFRASFDNRTRLIVTIFDEPFMMLKKGPNDTITEQSVPRGTILDPSRVEGFCVDLAEAICRDRLKFPYKFLIETKYGNEISKGVWNGMVGALVNHEADLSIASLTINGAREKAVDFSKPFIDLGISIMISKPEKQKPGVFSFMDPLSKEIWICVIVSYLLVSGILFFVSRFSSYEWYFENETDLVPRNKFSIHNALFFSFSAFMHQGVDLLPRSVSGLFGCCSAYNLYLLLSFTNISGRVVTSAWWFFSLILVSSYTANLAAFLTVENLITPIDTVEDLARQTDIRYGTLRGGSTMAFFNKSTITTFKVMWSFMQQHKDHVFVSSNREGIEKVRKSKGKFAFLLESTLNEYVNERDPCDTMRVGENIDSKGYGIATPLGSDLREAINIAVLELTESGFLERLKQKWYYERSQCTKSGSKDSKQSTPLNLANVAGMFYVLIIGLGGAMVIAFIEFLFKAKLDSARTNQNIREVMRRNLRISITGIDFDEKLQKANYLPLKPQNSNSSDHRKRQYHNYIPCDTNTFDLLNNNDIDKDPCDQKYKLNHSTQM